MGEFLIAEWILPILLVVGGYAAGKVFEYVVVRKLRKLTKRTSSRADDIFIDAVGKTTPFWFVLAGLYAAVMIMPIPPRVVTLSNTLLLIGFIASATLVAGRLAVRYVDMYAARVRGVLPSTTIFSNLTRALVYVIGLLVILQSLGISITPILTALGVGGLAVALALQDTLSNLFAGLQIIASGQVKPGDFIRLESGEEGYVVDVTWRNTTIRQLANNMIIVPNGQLASSRVTSCNPLRAESQTSNRLSGTTLSRTPVLTSPSFFEARKLSISTSSNTSSSSSSRRGTGKTVSKFPFQFARFTFRNQGKRPT